MERAIACLWATMEKTNGYSVQSQKQQKEKVGAKEKTQIEMDFVKKLKFLTNIYEIFLHGITHKFIE